jgi:hypothetical protein
MRTVAFAALILGCVLPAAARPQENSPELLTAACRELESNEPRRVFAAVQAIAQLGGAALPAIEARARDARGRVHDYLELAAEEIRSAPHLPGYPAVKRVSMKSTDRNVVELLADLRAKTGVALSLENLIDEEKLPELPFEVKDVTMLEAFDAICHAGNVTVSMQNGQFTLYTGAYVDLPRFFYGHYFLRLGEFELQKTVTFRKPATQTFTLDMDMVWDPVAAPLRFKPVRIVEAVDDRGKSLLLPAPAPLDPKAKPPETPPEDEEEPGPETKLRLAPPSVTATKIAVVRGFVTIVLPKSRQTANFPAPKESQTGSVGDVQIRILNVDPDQHNIRLSISSKKHTPEALSKMDFLSHVTLKDYESTASSVDKLSWDDESLDLAVTFTPLGHKDGLQRPPEGAAPPAIVALDLSVVTAVQDKRIPFEFRDLKLR